MKLFNTIDKVLASFGNIRAMERTHLDTFTEDLISNIKGTKIAASKFGQLFVTYQNLNGYDFLNATVLSGSDIKTYKGCELVFEFKNNKIVIPSDSKEIESDFSNVSNRYLTKISFVLEGTDNDMISKCNFEKVSLDYRKKSLVMDKV